MRKDGVFFTKNTDDPRMTFEMRALVTLAVLCLKFKDLVGSCL